MRTKLTCIIFIKQIILDGATPPIAVHPLFRQFRVFMLKSGEIFFAITHHFSTKAYTPGVTNAETANPHVFKLLWL